LNSRRGPMKVNAPRGAVAGYAAERIDARARLDGRRVSLDGRASAYGASATTSGRVTLPEGKAPIAFDLHGSIRKVDLRHLPHALNVPPAATEVNADYQVAGTPTDLTGSARFADSTVAGARIAAGSTAGFDVKGKEIGYR